MSNIFKNSSVVTVWDVKTPEGDHVIELNDNELTGKRCFSIDQQEIVCETDFFFTKGFDYEFDLDGHKCEISVTYVPGAHYAQTIKGHFIMDGEEIEPRFVTHG